MAIHMATVVQAPDALGDQGVAELKQRFRGPVLRPDDPDYDSAREIWNAMIERRPAAIARCTGTADSRGGRTVCPTSRPAGLGSRRWPQRGRKCPLRCGLTIDLSLMKGIRVAADRRRAWAQPGMRWGDFDHETTACGLASPGGTGRLAATLIEAAGLTVLVSTGLILALGIHFTYRLDALVPVGLTLLDIAGFGLLLGALAIRVASIGAILHVLQSIVLFLNGSFVPVSLFPGWLQLVARLLPTTLGIELSRTILLQGGFWFPPGRTEA